MKFSVFYHSSVITVHPQPRFNQLFRNVQFRRVSTASIVIKQGASTNISFNYDPTMSLAVTGKINMILATGLFVVYRSVQIVVIVFFYFNNAKRALNEHANLKH